MSESLDDLFHARVEDAAEPSDLMRERTFAAVARDRRGTRWRSAALRYAAALVIVIGGGGLAFWLVRPHETPRTETMTFVQPLTTAPAIEHAATVVLIVTSVPDADTAIRRWPQTTVHVTGPRARRIEVPAARYRATLTELAQLGTLRSATEHSENLSDALARANDAAARTALRDRLAFAHIDVNLETRPGT